MAHNIALSSPDVWISLILITVMVSIFILADKAIHEKRILNGIGRLLKVDAAVRFAITTPYDESATLGILKLLDVISYDELEYLLVQLDSLPAKYRKKVIEEMIGSRRLQGIRLTAIKGWSKGARVAAINILGRTRSDAFLSVLQDIVGSSTDEDIVYACIRSLGQNGSGKAAGALVSLLGCTGHASLSNSRIASILETFPLDIFDELVKRKDDENPGVRFWIATILGRHPNDSTAGVVEAMTRDRNPDVRSAAVKSLGKIKDTKAVGLLYERLDDEFWFVRLHALRALGELLLTESIPKITPALSDENWWIRYSAKAALKRYGRTAIPHLRAVLNGKDRFARNSAVELLEDIGYANEVFDTFLSDIPGGGQADALIELVRAGACSWFKSRLKDVDAHTRESLLRLVGSESLNMSGKIDKDAEAEVKI